MNGTAFESRDDAIASFKSKHSDQYPTKFESEPASRPSYIPASTSVGGSNYTVVYDTQYGGYGYAGPSGWVSYNPLMDAMILSSLMRDRDYVVVEQPVATSGGVVHHRSGTSFWGFMVACVVIGGCFMIVIVLVNKFGKGPS